MATALDLRPLNFGDILSRAFSLYRRNFGAAFGLFQILYVPLALGSIAVLNACVPENPDNPASEPIRYYAAFAIDFIFALGLAGPALCFVIARAYMGSEPSVLEGIRAVAKRAGPLAGVSLAYLPLIGLSAGSMIWTGSILEARHDEWVVLFGLLRVLLFMPLAIYFGALYGFSASVVIFEDVGALRALTRARELLRGYRWRFFWLNLSVLLLIGLLTIPVRFAEHLLTDHDQTLLALLVVEWWFSLLLPVIAVLNAVVYFDLRSRHEAFDVSVLAQSFGIDPRELPPMRRLSKGGFRMPPYVPPRDIASPAPVFGHSERRDA